MKQVSMIAWEQISAHELNELPIQLMGNQNK